MDKPEQLTRLCSSCGVPKPLSAFLQLTGPQGTTYGNICSDCRRLNKGKKSVPEPDERSTTTSGVRIGGKEKLAIDIDRKRHQQGLKELYKAESKKRELFKSEKEIVSEQKQKEEKEHRYYLESKKGFLSGTAKKLDSKSIAAGGTRVTTPEQKAIIARIGERARNITDVNQLEAMIAEELQNTTVDLTQVFFDPQFTDLRHNNPMINNYIQWLGTGASFARNRILRAMEQFTLSSSPGVTKIMDEKRGFLEKSKHDTHVKREREKKDVLTDYIEKTMGPSSTRRR